MAIAAVVIGVALTLLGLSLIHPPTALIVGGGSLIFFGLMYETDR